MTHTNDGFLDLMATNKQKRAYFGLMKKLKYTSYEAKEIMKKKYDLDSFADIDKERMSYAIDRLIQTVNRKEEESNKN